MDKKTPWCNQRQVTNSCKSAANEISWIVKKTQHEGPKVRTRYMPVEYMSDPVDADPVFSISGAM